MLNRHGMQVDASTALAKGQCGAVTKVEADPLAVAGHAPMRISAHHGRFATTVQRQVQEPFGSKVFHMHDGPGHRRVRRIDDVRSLRSEANT